MCGAKVCRYDDRRGQVAGTGRRKCCGRETSAPKRLPRDSFVPGVLRDVYRSGSNAAIQGPKLFQAFGGDRRVGQHFAKTGLVPVHLHRAILTAQEDRQTADYGGDREVTRDDAERHIGNAEEFVRTAKSYLEKEAGAGNE